MPIYIYLTLSSYIPGILTKIIDTSKTLVYRVLAIGLLFGPLIHPK